MVTKTELTYITMENIDHNGADLWETPKKCATWEEFIATAKSTLKSGQVMMWNSTNNNLFLKTYGGARPGAFYGSHVIICGRSL